MSNWYRQIKTSGINRKQIKDFAKGFGYGAGAGALSLLPWPSSKNDEKHKPQLASPPAMIGYEPASTVHAPSQAVKNHDSVSPKYDSQHSESILPPKPLNQSAPKSQSLEPPNVKSEEGVRAHVYEDPLVVMRRRKEGLAKETNPLNFEIPTIGIGHHIQHQQFSPDKNLFDTLNKDQKRYDAVRSGKSDLTQKEIEHLYDLDIKQHSSLAESMIKRRYGIDIRQYPKTIQDIIHSMFFQIGPKAVNFKGFFHALQTGDFGHAAIELFPNSEWARETPARVKRIADYLNSLAKRKAASTVIN